MPLRNLTLAECKSNCTKTPECKAVSYNRTYAACFLKSIATILFKNNIAFTAYQTQLEPNVRVSKLDFYSALGGEPFETQANADYVKCILSCEDSGKCMGFNFNKMQKICTLMDLVGEQTNNTNYFSGEKISTDP